MIRSLQITRRTALGACVALAACKTTGAGPAKEAPKEGELGLPPPDQTAARMPTRLLGKTGVRVSIVGLGGYHIGLQKDEAESIQIVRAAVERGITFLDNCWDYNKGASEERMGKALAGGYREKVFLMTKLDGRTRDVALAQLDQSMKRLRTDVIDLVQIHEIIRPGDPAACFAPGGCVEALVEAKKQGRIRFIGFTGHKHPDIHLAMLAAADAHGFTFDTVQMPLNVMDAHFLSFEKHVLPVLVQKGIGVLGMKALGAGKLMESNVVTARECLSYALNLPTSVVITGCDSLGVLEQAIDVALKFQPMDPQAVAELLARTSDAAKEGRFEKFKTAKDHDGTDQNPQWLTSTKL